MANQYQCVYFIAIFIGVLLASQAGAYTDPLDVAALEELYNTLNQPPQLTGWRLDGGDPCDESWNGVSCSGSSVIYLKLHGLNLSGYITAGLYNLYNLKQLDISSNSIGGEIPYVLPPNATHINMACNFFTQNIPLSLHGMKSLQHLNLSQNLLSGPIGNAFTGLQNLREMDLSYNNFTGDLPTSFGSLTNLTGLYLQNNQFTGSVAYLAKLPLTHMNLSHNLLSGPNDNGFTDLQNLQELYLKNNKFTGSVASLTELPPTDMKLENNTGSVLSQTSKSEKWVSLLLVASFVAVIGCCMTSRHATAQPAAAQPSPAPTAAAQQPAPAPTAAAQQPAPAPIAAAQQPAPAAAQQQPISIAQPDLFRPTFSPKKTNSPLEETFTFSRHSRYQLQVGEKFYTGASPSKVQELAYPEQQKVKPVRRLSFVNEDGDVEDQIKEDDD